MKLELQNIGGFTGVHRFELKKGINRITAPNAKGKSSLLRGLQCLASDDESLFRDVLNDDSDSGYVKLGDEYVRHLRRVNGIVQANPSEDRTFVDGNREWWNAGEIAFFTPKSRVVQEIGRNEFGVLRVVNSISRAEEIESDIRLNEVQLEGMKRELEEYIENLTAAQKLDAEIGTMQSEIRKLQDEVQELEGEIAEYIGTKDIIKIGEDIAAKKQEICYFEERIRSREGEVKRYQDQYEKARALYERLDEDIADFEQKSEAESVEEFTKKIKVHERRKKDMKTEKGLLDDLWGVGGAAYKLFVDSGNCPLCGQSVTLKQMNAIRDYLRDQITDISEEIRSVSEQIKVLKMERDELRAGIKGIKSKRLGRNKAKHDSNDLLKELDERKNLRGGIEKEMADKAHELRILEQQYADAAKTVRTESKDRLNKLLEKIGAYENEIRNNQSEMDLLTYEILDYTIGESLEDYANKKRLGLDNLRLKIEGLKDEWEHEVFGAVDLFNKNINDIYKEMGFTTFRDIKITKETTRGRLTSLDAVVEHVSGKKQSLSSLNMAEQLTLGLVFQISAKENHIPDFPFFVIDDNMNTFDPDRSRSIMEYLSDKVEYVLVSRSVPPSEQDGLVIKYGFD